MTLFGDSVRYQFPWLKRWEGGLLPSSSADWQAVVRAFPDLAGAAKGNPAWALVDRLYDDPDFKPGLAALRELRRLDTDRAVSGVVYWIFREVASCCAGESLQRAERSLDGLRRLLERTRGTLSSELTHLIRVGLTELQKELSRRRWSDSL